MDDANETGLSDSSQCFCSSIKTWKDLIGANNTPGVRKIQLLESIESDHMRLLEQHYRVFKNENDRLLEIPSLERQVSDKKRKSLRSSLCCSQPYSMP